MTNSAIDEDEIENPRCFSGLLGWLEADVGNLWVFASVLLVLAAAVGGGIGAYQTAPKIMTPEEVAKWEHDNKIGTFKWDGKIPPGFKPYYRTRP